MKGNTVSIKGNITRDAEVKRTQSGRNVLRFGIAWNSSRPDGNGGYQDLAHYFDVSCFPTDRQLTAIQPHIVKGAKCAIIDGHLDYSQWESNGQKRSAVQIIVDDPIAGLLVWKPTQSTPQNASGGYSQPNKTGGYQSNQNYIQNADWQDSGYYDSDCPF